MIFGKPIVIFLLGVWNCFAVPITEPLVKTSTGLVRGKTDTTPLGKNVDVFLGIPYAQPPIGKLRFKPTLEVEPWEGIFNATEPPLTCYQKLIPLGKHHPEFKPINPTTDFSEDCLKLNVWVPKEKPEHAPVMIFIYGGGHARGTVSCPLYEASILSTEEQVIVAMMNYRTASLGFLFLDHDDVPGNAGLYDQNLALKWIKANAEAFGGDPEKITIFGQSSGAASVGNHLLSPLSWGLFNRAIMESASPTADWAILSKEDAVDKSMTLVDNLGCPHDRSNITVIIDCLLAADPSDIIGSEIQLGYSFVFIHMPIVDGRFIPEEPKKLLKNGNFANVSLLTGSVKNEGSPFLLMIDPLKYSGQRDEITITKNDMIELLEFSKFNQLTTALVYFLYFGKFPEEDKSSKYVKIVSDVLSDYVFNCPLTEFDVQYSKARNDVFKYYFPHRSSIRVSPKWMGTVHGEELNYVFGDPFRGQLRYTKDEEILSRRIMRYWGNFARTGNPNNNTRDDEDLIKWPKYTPEGKEYLVLAPNSTAIGKGFREKFCLFWRDLRPEILKLVVSSEETEKNHPSMDNIVK